MRQARVCAAHVGDTLGDHPRTSCGPWCFYSRPQKMRLWLRYVPLAYLRAIRRTAKPAIRHVLWKAHLPIRPVTDREMIVDWKPRKGCREYVWAPGTLWSLTMSVATTNLGQYASYDFGKHT